VSATAATVVADADGDLVAIIGPAGDKTILLFPRHKNCALSSHGLSQINATCAREWE
jgi:hypothetical protein